MIILANFDAGNKSAPDSWFTPLETVAQSGGWGQRIIEHQMVMLLGPVAPEEKNFTGPVLASELISICQQSPSSPGTKQDGWPGSDEECTEPKFVQFQDSQHHQLPNSGKA